MSVSLSVSVCMPLFLCVRLPVYLYAFLSLFPYLSAFVLVRPAVCSTSLPLALFCFICLFLCPICLFLCPLSLFPPASPAPLPLRPRQLVTSVLDEQHRVFVDCLKDVDHRVDLRMLWEIVGLRVRQSVLRLVDFVREWLARM